MDKKRYGKVPAKPIDIYKKEEEEAPPKSVELAKKTIGSIALADLQKKNIKLAGLGKHFAEKIETLNNTVRSQPIKKVAGVIHYWLANLEQEKEKTPPRYFV